jgi:5-methylthioadenosine/S-adenosylhomocysteine deaminase
MARKRKDRAGAGARPSRRSVVQTAAGAIASGAAAVLSATPAKAQSAGGNANPALSRLQSARRILLKDCIALSGDPQVGDFAAADILIEDGTIREVRPGITADDAAIVDASNRIVIPGFVDTHSHSYQGLLRDTLPNGVVDPDYNRDIQNNITFHYEPADAYAGMLATTLAMLDMGTTTVVDVSQANHSPEHSDALLQALHEAGIRAVFGYSRGAGPRAQYPHDVERLRHRYFNSSDQLLTLALGVSLEPNLWQFARQHGLRTIVHIRFDSKRLLALDRAGLIRPGDEFIHCTHLNEAAWRLIKDSGGFTSHSPHVEMAMGHGMPSIQDALDHGLRPSLSCDHAATVGQDMFGMMRTTFYLQRLFVLQRRRNGEQDAPPLLTCRDILEFATLAGARCAALDGKIGTLTPGKQADIVLLRADSLNIWPLNNALSAVTNIMNASHVDAVFVGGKVKKWRGLLVDVDPARVRRLIAQARDAVLHRSGFKIDLVG